MLTVGVPNDASNLGFANGTNLAVKAFQKVETAGPKLPSPAQIADAVGPVIIPTKGREPFCCIPDEATNRVRVETKEEGDEKMVGVPEGLKRLLPDAVVGGCVHQEHAKQHEMASDTTGLGIVDLHRRHRPDLGFLDVEEAMPVLDATSLKTSSLCFLGWLT